MKRLELDGKPQLVEINSIKITMETLSVKDVQLQIVDQGNTSIFHIDEAFSIKKEKINYAITASPTRIPLIYSKLETE